MCWGAERGECSPIWAKRVIYLSIRTSARHSLDAQHSRSLAVSRPFPNLLPPRRLPPFAPPFSSCPGDALHESPVHIRLSACTKAAGRTTRDTSAAVPKASSFRPLFSRLAWRSTAPCALPVPCRLLRSFCQSGRLTCFRHHELVLRCGCHPHGCSKGTLHL